MDKKNFKNNNNKSKRCMNVEWNITIKPVISSQMIDKG